MRATISLEADVDRVNDIMYALIMQEIDPLHEAMEFMETAKPNSLHKGIINALDKLNGVTRQLNQYRDMIASFEKARFETTLPQNANEAALEVAPPAAVQVVAKTAFDQFVDSIRDKEETHDSPEG